MSAEIFVTVAYACDADMCAARMEDDCNAREPSSDAIIDYAERRGWTFDHAANGDFYYCPKHARDERRNR